MIIGVDAVLFDNDGVLVDSHAHVEQAWRQLSHEFALDFATLTSELSGVRAIDTLSRHLPEPQVAGAVRRLEDLEVSLASQSCALPGARALVQTLPRRSWAIVTSASQRLATARWSGAGIAVPEVIVSAEDVARGKPHPEPYLVAAERLGVDPTRCLIFEDSLSGAEAARAAGATVVAVGGEPWSYEPAVRVPDLEAVRYAAAENGASLTFSFEDCS